ncbi:Alcohol dehydrogenase transcription factor Myb/SANT-like [Popillia japonica]|uniref:Alcohol dehydrogenase transcription factor Myb/SANT-like n=1 Tax=Popillia japonica TaxID=7064 RepID=A0AAW1I8R2_POPJA
MCEKREWLKNEIDELINMYHNKPELWDVTSKGYKDRVKKRDALSDIAEKFETTVEEITRKIHKLRNQFNSEFKKVGKKKSGQSADEVYTSKWPYF